MFMKAAASAADRCFLFGCSACCAMQCHIQLRVCFWLQNNKKSVPLAISSAISVAATQAAEVSFIHSLSIFCLVIDRFCLWSAKRACFVADTFPQQPLCYVCCAMLCCAMLCYIVLCYAMLCHAVLCHAISCCTLTSYIILCRAMSCSAVPCYGML